MTTWKIEITEPHSGEIGEAVLHEDHGFAMEEYSYEAGRKLEVAVHDTHDDQVGLVQSQQAPQQKPVGVQKPADTYGVTCANQARQAEVHLLQGPIEVSSLHQFQPRGSH